MPFLPNLVVSLLNCGLCTCFLIEAINVFKQKKNIMPVRTLSRLIHAPVGFLKRGTAQ